MMVKKNTNILTKNDIKKLLDILDEEYKEAKCGLDYTGPLDLTVALILAAQCTDKRVNMIRPIVFTKYPTVYELANANISELEDIIHSCGFYKNKAKNIIKMANDVVNKYGGNIPNTMEKLTALPGIGRKSANIILQECFDITEGIAVDTHVTRITKKLGLTENSDPINIEKDLMKILPERYWNKINHMLVNHGRAICDAKKPKCDICPVNHICVSYKNSK